MVKARSELLQLVLKCVEDVFEDVLSFEIRNIFFSESGALTKRARKSIGSQIGFDTAENGLMPKFGSSPTYRTPTTPKNRAGVTNPSKRPPFAKPPCPE